MLVKAGRHELVNLRRHDRKRDETGAEQRQFQLGDEIFEQRGVDELGILSPGNPHERPYQHVVDLLGEEKAEDEGNAEAEQRLDQARAQLDQMIHQRGLAGLDVFVAHDALLSRGTSASTSRRAGIGRHGSRFCFRRDRQRLRGLRVLLRLGLDFGGCWSGRSGFRGRRGLVDVFDAESGALTSFCKPVITLPLAKPVAASLTSSKLFLRSAISASRIAS